MTAQILPFPAKSKPRPVPLQVPTSPKIVALWAEKEARKIAYGMNPNEHNRNMFDAAQDRWLAQCVEENYPA